MISIEIVRTITIEHVIGGRFGIWTSGCHPVTPYIYLLVKHYRFTYRKTWCSTLSSVPSADINIKRGPQSSSITLKMSTCLQLLIHYYQWTGSIQLNVCSRTIISSIRFELPGEKCELKINPLLSFPSKKLNHVATRAENKDKKTNQKTEPNWFVFFFSSFPIDRAGSRF